MSSVVYRDSVSGHWWMLLTDRHGMTDFVPMGDGPTPAGPLERYLEQHREHIRSAVWPRSDRSD